MIEERWKAPCLEGVFLKSRKPANFIQYDTADYKLFSIIKNKQTLRKTPLFVTQWFAKPIYEVATRLNHPG